jgi:hypothetical protein
VLAESGAIMTYIIERYGGGRLAIAVDHSRATPTICFGSTSPTAR